jgi:hypothetical protein
MHNGVRILRSGRLLHTASTPLSPAQVLAARDQALAQYAQMIFDPAQHRVVVFVDLENVHEDIIPAVGTLLARRDRTHTISTAKKGRFDALP